MLFSRLLPLLSLAAFILLASPIRAGQPTAEIPNASFEAGLKGPDQWETKGDVTFDENDKIDGKRSLHFKCDPATLPVTQAISQKFKISPGVWDLSGTDKYDLYSPDVSFNVSVGLRFYGNDGKELKNKTLVTASEKSTWAKFKERFNVPPGATDAAVAIEFNKTHGEFWIDGLSLSYVGESVPMEGGDRKTVFQTNRDGFLFYPGDYVTIGMELDTPVSLSADKLDFTWELTDFWGERQAASQKGKLVADGKAANGWNRYRTALDLSKMPLKTGPYYEVHTSVDLGAPSPAHDRASFAVLPEAATLKYNPMDIPFGAHTWNTTVYEFYPLSARLGLRRSLAFWTWPDTAPYTPDYDTGFNYDSRLGWAKKFGMMAWGELYPLEGVEHHSGKIYSDEALREGIRQSIEKYSAKDGLWGFQMGNEPAAWNDEMVKADVAAYKVLYDEVKKVDPKIVMIGTSVGPSEPFFKAGFQAYQDAYNIHAYSDLGELRRGMQSYRELFKKYGGEKPIFSTEIGSKGQGLPRDVIAKDIIRKVVCFFADGGGFFTWFATGGMSNPTGENSGSYSDSMDLFDSKYDMHMARLDAVAYYNIINALCVKKFVKEIDYPNGVDGFLFRDKDGNDLEVFWSTKGDGDYFVSLPRGVIDVTHYDGRSAGLVSRDGGINLRITEDPVLLMFHGVDFGRAAGLPKTLEPSPVTLVRVPDNFVQGTTSEITLGVAKDNTLMPQLFGPPLCTISPPTTQQDVDGSTLRTYQVTVPTGGSVRRATFQVIASEGHPSNIANNAPSTELLFSVPVKSQIEVDLRPVAGYKSGDSAINLLLTNHSDQEQTVKWKAELVNEMDMEVGKYNLADVRPSTAFFSGVAEDKTTLPPRQTTTITLPMAQADRLAIYRVRATAFDATGNPSTRERLVGGFAKAARATGKITLDGVLDEKDWQAAPAYAINEERQVQYFEAGAKKWAGPKDLSGVLRFLWDDKFLYVGVEVTDDIFRNTKQDDGLWGGDGLQFLINPYRQDVQGKGRYDYSMGFGQKGDQVWCHMSADEGTPAGEVKDIRLSTKRLDPKNGNMTYEVAFPWHRLAPFKPAPGALGLGMIINEDDGIGRRSSIDWFEGVGLKETDFVGDVILTK